MNRIGRERRERIRETNTVAFRIDRPSLVGAAITVRPYANPKPPGSRLCASRRTRGEFAPPGAWNGGGHFGSRRFPAPRECFLCGDCAAVLRNCIRNGLGFVSGGLDVVCNHELRYSCARRASALGQSLPMKLLGSPANHDHGPVCSTGKEVDAPRNDANCHQYCRKGSLTDL